MSSLVMNPSAKVDTRRFTAPDGDRPDPTVTGAWSRFHRSRNARWGAGILAALTLLALVGLPYSARWFNVQAVDLAVRHSPAWRSIVPRERFTPQPALSGVAHRASSWFGHDDLGRSVLFRLLLGMLLSLGIGLAAATITVILGTVWGRRRV